MNPEESLQPLSRTAAPTVITPGMASQPTAPQPAPIPSPPPSPVVPAQAPVASAAAQPVVASMPPAPQASDNPDPNALSYNVSDELEGGSKKQVLMVAASLLGVVILAVGIGLLSIRLLRNEVTKDQLVQASKEFKDVTGTYKTASEALNKVAVISPSDDEATITGNIERATAALASYSTASKNFAKSSVFKNPAVDYSYKNYKEKNDSYITYMTDTIESYKKFAPVALVCNSASASYKDNRSAGIAALMAPCEQSLSELKSLKNTEMNTFLVAYKKYVTTTKDTLVMNEASVKANDTFSTAQQVEDIEEAFNKMNDAFKQSSRKITKQAKDLEMKDQNSSFQKTLDDQIKAKK